MTKKQMKTAEVDFDDETVASTDKKYGATIVSASADASLDYLDASTLDNVEDNGFHKGEFNQDLKKEGVSVNWLDSKLSRYNQSDIKNLNPNPKKNNTNNLTKIDSNILSAENEEQKLENEINNSNKEIDQNQDIIASAKNVISILKKQKSVIKAEENDLFHSPVFEPFFSLYYKNNPNSELAFLLIQVTIHLVHF